ncbi:hypothetical protein IEO21_05221 [Rhodonia placenta]|uniref:Uncharacterized protein n=1 Tax=Rhodonia placenta TaxID=104341 RepID=A0A8H7P299_9APHY|nr:hypothetical protein IEO21_05221 [Postia placenta]
MASRHSSAPPAPASESPSSAHGTLRPFSLTPWTSRSSPSIGARNASGGPNSVWRRTRQADEVHLVQQEAGDLQAAGSAAGRDVSVHKDVEAGVTAPDDGRVGAAAGRRARGRRKPMNMHGRPWFTRGTSAPTAEASARAIVQAQGSARMDLV